MWVSFFLMDFSHPCDLQLVSFYFARGGCFI